MYLRLPYCAYAFFLIAGPVVTFLNCWSLGRVALPWFGSSGERRGAGGKDPITLPGRSHVFYGFEKRRRRIPKLFHLVLLQLQLHVSVVLIKTNISFRACICLPYFTNQVEGFSKLVLLNDLQIFQKGGGGGVLSAGLSEKLEGNSIEFGV